MEISIKTIQEFFIEYFPNNNSTIFNKLQKAQYLIYLLGIKDGMNKEISIEEIDLLIKEYSFKSII